MEQIITLCRKTFLSKFSIQLKKFPVLSVKNDNECPKRV